MPVRVPLLSLQDDLGSLEVLPPGAVSDSPQEDLGAGQNVSRPEGTEFPHEFLVERQNVHPPAGLATPDREGGSPSLEVQVTPAHALHVATPQPC